jgi:hypothetical protein
MTRHSWVSDFAHHSLHSPDWNSRHPYVLNTACKHNIHHINHLTMGTETVSEMSATNSTLTHLVAWQEFIVYYHHESFKSYYRLYEWLQMRFGLVIEFIYRLQIITTNNYSNIANSLQHALSLFSLLCLHQSLPRNGFQQQTFPLLWVPELSPCLSYQLLIAMAHNDWTAAVL